MVESGVQFTLGEDLFYASEKFEMKYRRKINAKKKRDLQIQPVMGESKTLGDVQNYWMKKELKGNEEVLDTSQIT